MSDFYRAEPSAAQLADEAQREAGPISVARDALATVDQMTRGKSPDTVIYPAEATAIGVVAALSALGKRT